jgi:hypothetical protein
MLLLEAREQRLDLTVHSVIDANRDCGATIRSNHRRRLIDGFVTPVG